MSFIDMNLSALIPMKRLTFVFYFMLNMSDTGHSRVMISTVDTDVLVIATAMFSETNLDQLWLEFGIGKNLGYIPIRELE